MVDNLALALYNAHRYDEALEAAEDGVKLDPEDYNWPYLRGLVYDQQGKLEQAVEQYEEAIALGGGVLLLIKGGLGYAYAVAGRTDDARRVLAELQEEATRREVSPVHLAVIAIGLGDKDRAFAWLDEAFEQRSTILIDVAWGPWFDPLRSDPRYADLIKRTGWPQQ